MERGDIRLKSIEIQGFKSIPFNHPMHLELGDENILIGANGSGKSNILSFFVMLAYMMKGILQRYVALHGTSQSILHYGTQHTASISASLKFSNGCSMDEYKFTLCNIAPERLMIASEELVAVKSNGKDTNESVSKQLGSNRYETALLNSVDTKEQLIRNLLLSCKVYNFCDTTFNSTLRSSCTANGAHYLYSDGSNLASFLYFLRNNYFHSYERIRNIVQFIIPQFHDFYLEPENGYISLRWIDDSAKDYMLGVDQLSDGALRFIALATLLLQPAQTMPFVILLDAPERDLHPFALSQLAEMIQDAALHAQIIVATQSNTLLDEFTADEVIVIERDKEKGGTTTNKLSLKEYDIWLQDYTLS